MRIALAVSGVLLSALAAPTSARLQPPSFADVLQRAHKYVTLYEDHELSTVIALFYAAATSPALPAH